MIRARCLNVCLHKKEIVKNVSFQWEAGELIALVGPNGAGKTTLLKTITGLIKPTSGAVLYEDTPLDQIPIKERAKKVAYIPQNSELWLKYRVEDFAAMGSTPFLPTFQQPGIGEKKRVDEALDVFDIVHLRERNVDEISGGERKLAYLARARVQQATWMVLDEPLAALDIGRQHKFLSYLRTYVHDNQTGAVFSVHNPAFALQYADRIIVLSNGEIKGMVSRKEENFALRFAAILKEVYTDSLELIQIGDKALFYWRD
ncbi:MAG: ABC transporter ATP-binding protein [Lachnospiraceae bacterium]